MNSSRSLASDASTPSAGRPTEHLSPSGAGFADGMGAARRPTGPIVAVLVVLGAFSVGHVLFALPLSLLLGSWTGDAAALAGQTFNNVVPFAGALLALFLWVRLREQRPFSSLGFRSRPNRALVGAAVALGMLAAMVMVAVVLDQVQVQDRPVDGALVAGVLLALAGFIVQASTEDLLFRGFLLQAGVRRWGVAAGVALQAVVFSLLHSINPGGLAVLPLVNLLLFAVFLAVWALLEGGLWVAFAWHAVWNWTQGNVLGVQVSGETVDTSLLHVSTAPGSSDLITGGSFGFEGGLLTTAVLLIGMAAVSLAHRLRAARRRVTATEVVTGPGEQPA